jgi:hypothetical protein
MFDDIKSGDEVAMREQYYGTEKWHRVQVKRATKALLVVDIPNMAGQMYEHKFWRENGRGVGQRGSSMRRYLHPLDDETRESIRRCAERVEANNLAERVKRGVDGCSLDQLRRMVAIMGEG